METLSLRVVLSIVYGTYFSRSVAEVYEALSKLMQVECTAQNYSELARKCKEHILTLYPLLDCIEIQHAVEDLKSMLNTEVGKKSPEYFILGWIYSVQLGRYRFVFDMEYRIPPLILNHE